MTENDKQIQDEKEKNNSVNEKNDDKKSKKSKSKIPTEIHLKDYFLKDEIKGSDFKKFYKNNFEFFEDDCKNFEFENIKEVEVSYINKIIDLVPEVINSKTKYISKKLFEFIFKKHDVKINFFPILEEDFKSFIKYQKKYVSFNRDNEKFKEIKEFELKILRVLLVLLKDKQWFNVNLFIDIFEPFKAGDHRNEIGALIQDLSLSKNGTNQLISFSSILDKGYK